MKHWQETEQVLGRLFRPGSDGRPAALAVVVRIEGSAYRRPGAKLLVEDDGASLGGVSGGCLEEDVRQIAFQVMRSAQPCLRRYDTGSDETKVWGLGLGCDGRVDVLVLPVTEPAARRAWRRVHERLGGEAPFAVTLGVAGPDLGSVAVVGETDWTFGDDALAAARGAAQAGRSALHSAGERQLFTDVLVPPPPLLICGAGDDAVPVARFAAAVGFRVLVADHRAAYATRGRFPEARHLFVVRAEEAGGLPLGPHTHAVVMTHSLRHDREWARRLLSAGVAYVGLLGPRARTESILAEVGAAGSERAYGPVGLDLGAEGPEQVALSILAEVLAFHSRREPRHLREREAPVHA